MKFNRKLAVLALAFLFSVSAFAGGKDRRYTSKSSGSPWYWGVGASVVSYDNSFDIDFSNTMLEGRIGYKYSKIISFEGRAAFAITDDDVVGTGAEVSSYFGVYAVGSFPVGRKGDAYGFLGFTHVGVDTSGPLTGVQLDDASLSFGIGFRFRLDRRSHFGIEYISLYDDDGEEVTAFNFSYRRAL